MRTANELKHYAELALIRAIPILTIGNLKPSRTKGLFDRLVKYTDRDLNKLSRLTSGEQEIIWHKVKEFGHVTGWLNKEKHTATLLFFCLRLIKKSHYDLNNRIGETIDDLIDHFENGNDLHSASCWAGDNAGEVWQKLFE